MFLTLVVYECPKSNSYYEAKAMNCVKQHLYIYSFFDSKIYLCVYIYMV